MPVNWVDGVTDVNAANLEIMEADTAAKQATSEKGAANGYAPLDATSKVPLINLPPVSGVDYIGDWGSGIAYKRGDVVRYGGNDYLAVNDSTGVAPPAPFVAPGNVGRGTSLPTSPFDGQEYVLVDSLTNPTYQWRFRYCAGSSSPFKWEYVGGTPWYAIASVASWTAVGAASTWVLLPEPLSFSVPRAGDYWGETSAQAGQDSLGDFAQLGLGKAATPSTNPQADSQDVTGHMRTFGTAGRVNDIQAGGFIAACYWGTTAATAFANRWLAVTPVRVA